MRPAHHQQQEDGRPPQHLTAKWRLRLVMLLLLRPSCCRPVAETLKQNLDVPLLSCHCTKEKRLYYTIWLLKLCENKQVG
jgi:hypothetical protein